MTFWRAQERARTADGQLILRIEDLDEARCRPEFRQAMVDDLRWFGLTWQEGPDVGGPFAPYSQSERRSCYLAALQQLVRAGHVYPCTCSRKDVNEAAAAPHDESEEPIYPGTCRPARMHAMAAPAQFVGLNWRFRVPADEEMHFRDMRLGEQRAVAGRDFGDFVVWRRDDVPAYQLAVVVDDAAMQVTEVVRGEDLLVSTFRQLLLYLALGKEPPAFYHTPLLRDEQGRRLAKRHASLSLRALRQAGAKPAELRERFAVAL